MRVKMRTVYASDHATGQPGAVIDLPEAEAKDLVAGGYATAVDALPTADEIVAVEPVESAVVAAPETAVTPAQERPRGRKG